MSRTERQGTKINLELSDSQLAETRENVVSFIEEQVTTAGADGAVIGLSGGVDSTLTAYLAVEALGSEQVHGLVMPGEVSQSTNMSDAEQVAQDLGIDYEVIGISGVLETLLDEYPDARGDEMAIGNARARIRTVLNYLVANHENWLVLGTGNRTEFLTGYFTKYGDGAVDCLPIGNLYKQQVRQLARYVGAPKRIVEKPATAGLWAGQTDEEELGIEYDVLDAILALHIDGPNASVLSCEGVEPPEMILLLDTDHPLTARRTAELVGVNERTVKKVQNIYKTSEHKRMPPPTPDPPY